MSEPDGVGVVLYHGRKVLLQKRDDRPKLFPNYWAIFGGQIGSGEGPKEAARRELREELEYDLDQDSLRYLGKIKVLRDCSYPFMHYFSAPLTSELRELKLAEGNGFAYFHQEELGSTTS
jgi:8-oxo-dGTP pyrophosphatase MutT (NUDIX family)